MVRWLVRLLIGLVVLLVLLVVAVQAVLWSDLPRQVAEDQIAAQTGLEATLADVSATWGGHTEVAGLSLKLPLADQPFAKIDRITLEHTSLPGLVLGFSLDRVEVASPTLHVRRLSDGQWNLARVANVVAANQAPSDESQGGSPMPLPKVRLGDVTVTVEKGGRTTTISPIRLSLSDPPPPGGGHALDATVPGLATLSGRVAGQPPYTHQLTLNLEPTGDWVPVLLGEAVTAVQGKVTLQGATTPDGGYAGAFNLTPITYQKTTKVTGGADLTYEGGRLTLRPNGLKAAAPEQLPTPVTLIGGTAAYGEQGVELTDFTAEALGGRASVTGEFDPADLAGEMKIRWAGMQYPRGVEHGGAVTLDISRKRPGRRSIEGQIEAQGQTANGPWRGTLAINLTGRKWDRLGGQVTLKELLIRRPQRTLDLSSLTADFALTPKMVTLNELTIGDTDRLGELHTRGQWNRQSGDWRLSLRGEQLGVADYPRVDAVSLEAHGVLNQQTQRLVLERSDVSMMGVKLSANGAYAAGAEQDQRVDATVTLKQAPLSLQDKTRQMVQADELTGKLAVDGSIRPFAVTAEGALLAAGIQVREQPIGDVRIRLNATANDERLSFDTKQLDILGGQWALKGRYDLNPKNGTRHALSLNGQALDLAKLTRALAGQGLVTGQGEVTLDGRASSLDIGAVKVSGDIGARDVAVGPVQASRVTSQVTIEDGRARVHEIEVQQAPPAQTQPQAAQTQPRAPQTQPQTRPAPPVGRLTGELSLPLDDPTRLRVGMNLGRWAVRRGPPVTVVADGRFQGEVNAAGPAGTGSGRLRLEATTRQHPMTSIRAGLTLSGPALRITPIEGDLFGGELSGQAHLDLQSPLTASRVELAWQGVQPPRLEPLVPPFEQTRGRVAGRLTLQPRTAPHTQGQMQLSLVFDPTNLGYGPIPIGDTEILFYHDGERFVLDKFESRVAGGKVDLFARLSPHLGQWHIFATGTVDRLDLTPIARTVQPGSDPLKGRVTVHEANLVTSLPGEGDGPIMDHLIRRLHGRGRVSINESELGRVPLFGEFYDFLSLNFGERAPQGEGQADFRFEEGKLAFQNLRYENPPLRAQVFGLVIDDLLKGEKSPIRGYAIASASPLPEFDALEMVNKAITTIQQDFATVNIAGTLANPQITPRALDQFTEPLGNMLGLSDNDEGEQQSKDQVFERSTPNATQPSTQPAPQR